MVKQWLSFTAYLKEDGYRIARKISVFILGFHTCVLGWYLLNHSTSDYYFWKTLFSQNWMRSLNTLYLLSLCGHGGRNMYLLLQRYFTSWPWLVDLLNVISVGSVLMLGALGSLSIWEVHLESITLKRYLYGILTTSALLVAREKENKEIQKNWLLVGFKTKVKAGLRAGAKAGFMVIILGFVYYLLSTYIFSKYILMHF